MVREEMLRVTEPENGILQAGMAPDTEPGIYDITDPDESMDPSVFRTEEEDDAGDAEEDDIGEEIPDSLRMSSSVDYYLSTAGKTPLLTAEQETELGRRVKNGDREAETELIEKNLRLVISIAKKYLGCGLDMDDLIQSGSMGLMKAAQKYDPDLGYRFSTYASWWIKQGITRAISDTGKSIRIPVHVHEKILKIKRVRRDFEQDSGRLPTAGEIAGITGIPEKTVMDILELPMDVVSLDKKIGEEDDSTIMDFIVDSSTAPMEDEMEKGALVVEMEEIINSTLSDREALVIRRRFGLDGGRICTLEEVGQELGVTRERIRQIEVKSIRKLKRGIARRKGISNEMRLEWSAAHRRSFGMPVPEG